MRKSLRKISAAIAGCALAMALTVGAVPNAANAAVKPQCTKDGEKQVKQNLILMEHIMHTSDFSSRIHGFSVISGSALH